MGRVLRENESPFVQSESGRRHLSSELIQQYDFIILRVRLTAAVNKHHGAACLCLRICRQNE